MFHASHSRHKNKSWLISPLNSILFVMLRPSSYVSKMPDYSVFCRMSDASFDFIWYILYHLENRSAAIFQNVKDIYGWTRRAVSVNVTWLASTYQQHTFEWKIYHWCKIQYLLFILVFLQWPRTVNLNTKATTWM